MLLPRKRKRRTDNNNHGAASAGPDGLQERRKGRPGRPMKRPEELTKPRSRILQEQRIIHEQAQQNAQQSPALSPFEKLPTELIQHIFFDALEPNLAMTCTIMNQALSSESVFRSLLLLAYHQPRNYAGEISEVDEKVFLPARYRYLCHNERLDLQRVITGYRWCNLARVRGIVPTLSKMAAKASFEQERRDREALGSEFIKWDPPDDALPDLPDPDDIGAIQERYSAWQSSPIYRKLENYQGWPFSPQSGDDDAMPFLRIPDSEFPVNKKFRHHSKWRMSIKCPVLGVLLMPGNVLRGNPWTAEKLAMLRLLRQGLRAESLHLDNSNVHEWRSFFIPTADMFEGMACAIRERNQAALLTLLELFLELTSLETGRMSARYGASVITHRGENDSKNTPCRLPVTLFHLAAKADQWSTVFLWLLSKADIGAIPLDDEVMTAWAVRAAPRSSFARWLLRLMEESEHELPRGPQGHGWLSEDAPLEEQTYGKDLFSCHHLWEAVGYVR